MSSNMTNSFALGLPLELVDLIISLVDSHGQSNDLYTLLFVNSHFHALSLPRLYRALHPNNATHTVRLLRSLTSLRVNDGFSRLPSRQGLVKTMDIQLTHVIALKGLLKLISKVLRLLPNLKDLSLALSSTHNGYAWILPWDAPFRLESFTTSLQSVISLSVVV